MPSYYNGGANAQYATQADYASRYNHLAYGAAHDVSSAYSQYNPSSAHDLAPMLPDPYDQYKNSSASNAAMYDQSAAYPAGPLAAPFVPPSRLGDRWSAHQHQQQQDARRRQQEAASHQEQRQKEEKSVGGVSATLDYDMEQMTDFVAEMANGIIKPGTSLPPTFRKWVLQVLNATRLPSATIILSLSYLALRVRDLSASGAFAPSDRGVYQMLTVALILGSKFLDDNTFQNKSWSEVSNITVDEINKDEREWLVSFGHRLHHDPNCSDGFASWEGQWLVYRSRASTTISALRPLDTNVRRPYSGQPGCSPNAYSAYSKSANVSSFASEGSYHPESAYPTPTYAAYDAWYGPRPAMDRSPSTAPHSGPHTPEYYGTQVWGAQELYSRRSQFSYPPLQTYTPTSAYPTGYNTPSFPVVGQNNYWNTHGAGCQCVGCRQHMMPRYGPIVVG